MITKQEYIEALERMEESYYNLDGCMSAMNKFKEDINLIAGLVNEHFEEKDKHFEEKQETNLERYYDDLIKEDCSDFGVVNGKIESCTFIPCEKCEFKLGNCHKNRIIWLTSKCEKPKYKLTQCEYDMLDTIFENQARFSKVYLIDELKKKGYFKNIKCDSKVRVKDILANCEVVG